MSAEKARKEYFAPATRLRKQSSKNLAYSPAGSSLVSPIRLLLSLLSSLVILSSFCLANPLKDSLSTEFKGKSFLIKGFPQDTKLEVNNNFQPTKQWHTGSWTLANMVVEGVNADHHNVEFSGHRVGFLYDAKTGKMIK